MKISGSNVEVSYGDQDKLDWRKHQAEHPEAERSDDEDSEEATPEEKAHAKAILGFDPAEEAARSKQDGESTGDAELDEMGRRVEAAPTREEKLAVLRGYMSHNQATNALGLLMGDHEGDVIDRNVTPS